MTPSAIGLPSGFWGRPYRVEASSDPDTAVSQVVAIMAGHVRNAATDTAVPEYARSAALQFGGLSGDTSDANRVAAVACWWWAKLYIKFVHHETLMRQIIGESGNFQGLIAPEILVRMDKPEGDCAIFTELIAAFLRTLGVDYEFVTIAVNPREPGVFSHVYLYAVMQDGARLPLDASHGDYPGWQVPSSRVTRRQVWNADGQPVPDRASRFEGLGMYGLRGLGTTICDADGANCYDDGLPDLPASGGTCPGSPGCPGYIDPSVNAAINASATAANNTAAIQQTLAANPGSYAAPSQSNSAAWAAFSQQALKDGFTLAAVNSMAPGTVINPNGQIIRQATGLAVPVGTTTGILSTSGSSSTILMFGGLALVALLFMGGRH